MRARCRCCTRRCWCHVPHGTEDFHALYIVDELLAPSVGAYPLGRYVPQYTTLAGYPLWPVVRLFPSHTLGITFAFMTVLQVATFAAAFVLVRRACGSRWAVLGTFVIARQPCSTIGRAHSSVAGYWAVFPLRSRRWWWEPCWPRGWTVRRRWPSFVLLGLLGGTATLNDPEFGLPTLGAAAFVFASDRSWTVGLKRICLLTAGVACAPSSHMVSHS